MFNESLDASHELSQEIDNATGSYWHGIMHRMEGDYSNAKYWFHRVGRHPVYEELSRMAGEYIRGENLGKVASTSLRQSLSTIGNRAAWDPLAFVDAVKQQVTVAREEAADGMLRHIQWLEMHLLLQYAYAQSGGEGRLVELE
ncbi:hypothetical protein LJK87_04045 [Paenibacillus sp. P25]|nr:hypothetical protein LJK87_04045 [Paenibacillus sp. P25]